MVYMFSADESVLKGQFTQKCKFCHYSMDYFNNVLFWALNVSVALQYMEGQKALGFNQKYLNLYSEDEQILWVWNDIRVSN